MGSFAEYLRPLTPYLSSQLVSAQAQSEISFIASRLPETLAYSPFWFECRLGEETAKADFSVSATAALRGRDGLAQLDTAVLTHPIWQRVHNFATHWADRASPLYTSLDHICLEFDLDEVPSEVPLPSVFFGLRSGHIPDRSQSKKQELADHCEMTRIAIQLLTSSEIAPAVLKAFSLCLESLPTGAHLIFIGTMLARNAPGLRCVFQGMNFWQIVEYLSKIGWEGEREELEKAFAPVSDYTDTFWLAIDVAEAVGPKIGIECYFSQQHQSSTRWSEFLDYLVEQRWSTEQKRDALLAYPGSSTIESDPHLWPENLHLISRLFGTPGFMQLNRAIHHVKLVYQPRKPVEAKVYLHAEYR